MAQYTVDSFIVELGFSEKVIKGLQRVEKMSMQAAQRIERNINKAFDVKPNKSSQEALNRIVKMLSLLRAESIKHSTVP